MSVVSVVSATLQYQPAATPGNTDGDTDIEILLNYRPALHPQTLPGYQTLQHSQQNSPTTKKYLDHQQLIEMLNISAGCAILCCTMYHLSILLNALD